MPLGLVHYAIHEPEHREFTECHHAQATQWSVNFLLKKKILENVRDSATKDICTAQCILEELASVF